MFRLLFWGKFFKNWVFLEKILADFGGYRCFLVKNDGGVVSLVGLGKIDKINLVKNCRKTS